MGVWASSLYNAYAHTLNLTDITSSDNNAKILRRLHDNDPKLRSLYIRRFGNGIYYRNCFVVGVGDDLMWLGYFIGRNKVLTELHIHIHDMPGYREQIATLVKGIEQNRSILHISIKTYGDLGEAEDHFLSSLSAMIQSESCSLTSLYLYNIPLGDEVAVALADALKGNKSLKRLVFSFLSREQIPILVRGIEQNRSIQHLRIDGDGLGVGESVLSSLSAMLQSGSCSLTTLDLDSIP